MLATYNVELDISFEGNDVIIKYEQLETSSTTLLEIEAV
jgi:nitrite reductase (NADH) small subunit